MGVKLTRKGLPAGSWHWQALPKPFFSKRNVVVVVVVVGLGGMCVWFESFVISELKVWKGRMISASTSRVALGTSKNPRGNNKISTGNK